MLSVKQIAVIGECMVELKHVDGRIEQGFGGDTLNTAIYLSRMTRAHGITTAYVTGLGRDPFSQAMLQAWQNEGIRTDLVDLSPEKLPGIYAIETADNGERSFYYWRNDSAARYWLRGKDPIRIAEQLSGYGLIYLSGISLAILPQDCRESLLECLTICHKNGVAIAFDNNYRPSLWQSPSEAQHWYSRLLSLTTFAFLTFDDEAALWGDTSVTRTIARARHVGIEELVIKRGGDACLVIRGDSEWSIAPEPVRQVTDTTAAGDSFSAGYLAVRISGGSCEAAAMAAHRLAGQVIQHHGAIIPKQYMPDMEGK